MHFVNIIGTCPKKEALDLDNGLYIYIYVCMFEDEYEQIQQKVLVVAKLYEWCVVYV